MYSDPFGASSGYYGMQGGGSIPIPAIFTAEGAGGAIGGGAPEAEDAKFELDKMAKEPHSNRYRD